MILVLGPGRSGTSTVARILHTKLGVCMGRRFREPNEANTAGYYEDLDFLEVNTDSPHYGYRETLVSQLFNSREEPWGLKEPRIPHWWRIYRAHVTRDTKIIIAVRAPHLIVQSLKRNYGWGDRDSLNVIRERLDGIDQLTKGFDTLKIDFTDRRSDDEVTKILTNYVR